MGPLLVDEAVLRRARGRVDAAEELITGRAALLGLVSRGRVSAGGATRLLRTIDGWCALTLSRDDDLACVPALLESDDGAGWPDIEAWAAGRTAEQVRDRARLLDLPVAVLGEAEATEPRPRRIGAPGPRGSPPGCWWST